jgi:hypothetical protein
VGRSFSRHVIAKLEIRRSEVVDGCCTGALAITKSKPQGHCFYFFVRNYFVGVSVVFFPFPAVWAESTSLRALGVRVSQRLAVGLYAALLGCFQRQADGLHLGIFSRYVGVWRYRVASDFWIYEAIVVERRHVGFFMPAPISSGREWMNG